MFVVVVALLFVLITSMVVFTDVVDDNGSLDMRGLRTSLLQLLSDCALAVSMTTAPRLRPERAPNSAREPPGRGA